MAGGPKDETGTERLAPAGVNRVLRKRLFCQDILSDVKKEDPAPGAKPCAMCRALPCLSQSPPCRGAGAALSGGVMIQAREVTRTGDAQRKPY